MAGTLDFVLGLQVNKFLENCHISEVAIIGLEKAGEMLKVSMEKVWSQIERGAALNDLSKRTGETVETLFKLQKGFTAAGVSSDSVTMSLFQLNKSLGGINEMGENTKDVFSKVGLSVDELKKMGSGDALTAVLEKMSKMDQASATKFGASIFGRGVAGDMVQMSRSLDEFEGGMKRASGQAAVFQRMAAIFDDVEKAVGRVKAKLDPIFLVIAEHIAPALKELLDAVNNFDISPIVSGLGDALDAVVEAFHEGRLLELLSATFEAAVEYFGNLLFGLLGSGEFWGGIWDVAVGAFFTAMGVVLKFFMNVGLVLKSGVETAFNYVFEQLGKLAAITSKLGLKSDYDSLIGYKADTFGETFARNRAEAGGANDMLSAAIGRDSRRAMGGFGKIFGAVKSASADAGGEAQDRLSEIVDELLGNAPAKGKGAKATKAGNSVDLANVGRPKTDATDLEKLGFVFGGGASVNHAATTAKNTTQIASDIRIVADAVAKGGGQVLSNAHA